MTAFTKDIIKSCIQTVAQAMWKLETASASKAAVQTLNQSRFADYENTGEHLTKKVKKGIVESIRIQSTSMIDHPEAWGAFYGSTQPNYGDEGINKLQQDCTDVATRFVEAIVWDSYGFEDAGVSFTSMCRELDIKKVSRLMACGAIKIIDGSVSDITTHKEELCSLELGSLLDSALRKDGLKHMGRTTLDGERLNPIHKKGNKLGKVAKKTEEILHNVEYAVNGWMFGQINKIWEKIKNDKFVTKDGKEVSYSTSYNHIMVGCANTIFAGGLFSTWSFDAQLRMYMDAYHGAHCQSGSFERSLFQYAEPILVTKGSEGHRQLMLEMTDMSFKMSHEVKELMRLHGEESAAKGLNRLVYKELVPQCKAIVTEGAQWMVKQVKMKNKKAFITYLAAHQFLRIHKDGEGHVTVSAGLDAKCSGAQYLAIGAGSSKIAELCGMTTKSQAELGNVMIDGKEMPFDPYTNALNFYRGKLELGRTEIKTPFMAKQYEGTYVAMYEGKLFNFGGIAERLKYQTSENYTASFWAGHSDAKSRAYRMNKVATNLGMQEAMHMENGIDDSFGKEIKELKRWLKEVGFRLAIANNEVSYKTTNGERITYKKFFKCKWESSIHSEFLGFTESTTNEQTRCISHKIETKILNYDKMGRDMVVSWVQHLDALVMGTIVIEANKLGIKNISPIHDCVRFDVNHAHLCKLVCANAYREVFVNSKQVQNLVDQFDSKPYGIDYDMVISEDVLANGFYFTK